MKRLCLLALTAALPVAPAPGLPSYAQQIGHEAVPPEPKPAPVSEATVREAIREAIRSVVAPDDKPESRATALVTIAELHLVAGERAEARTALRRAIEAIRSPAAGQADASTETRLMILIWIAYHQDRAGDRAAIPKTLELACDAAATLPTDLDRIREWSRIALAQAAAGDPSAAQATLGRVRARALAPEPDRATNELKRHKLLDLQAKLGDYDGAIAQVDAFFSDALDKCIAVSSIADAVVSPGWPPSGDLPKRSPEQKATARKALTRLLAMTEALGPIQERFDPRASIAVAQAQIGDFEAARQTAREMGLGRLDEVLSTLHRIADAQLASGDRDGARATARLAFALARTLPAATPQDRAERSESLDQVAVDLAAAGDTAGAFQAIDAIDPAALAPRTPEAVAAGLAEAGDRAAARRSLRRALEVARGRLDKRTGRPADDEEPWFVADGEGHLAEHPKSDAARRAEARVEVARIEAKLGDLPAARATIDTLAPGDAKDRASRDVAAAWAKVGDPAAVLAWARGLPAPTARAMALRATAEALIRRQADPRRP